MAWLAFGRHIGATLDPIGALEAFDALSDTGWWWPFRGLVILTERPSRLRRDDTGRLHSHDGPALAYPDGYAVYASHGVRIPARLIEQPDTIKPREILDEPNAEVRRVMLERLPGGIEAYVRGVNAKQISRDEFGTLWQIDQRDDEPIVVVQVTNSTPEPDGHFKDYWFRVEPNCRPMLSLAERHFGAPQPLTPRNAIASMWGKTGEQYAPSVQS